MSKFVQFTPEESVNFLLGIARRAAHTAVKIARNDPYQAVSLAQTGQMITAIGVEFSIDWEDPENADLRAAIVEEYQEWCVQYMNKR